MTLFESSSGVSTRRWSEQAAAVTIGRCPDGQHNHFRNMIRIVTAVAAAEVEMRQRAMMFGDNGENDDESPPQKTTIPLHFFQLRGNRAREETE